MTGFHFRAPTLYDPSATPGEELRTVLHGAKGMAELLAKGEKLARWLAAEMNARGLDTSGPFIDEGGWILQTKSQPGFVVCDVSGGARDDDSLFYMLVSRFGGATEEVPRIVEDILTQAPEITELEVERG
jgi:hypothetical protein